MHVRVLERSEIARSSWKFVSLSTTDDLERLLAGETRGYAPESPMRMALKVGSSPDMVDLLECSQRVRENGV